MRLAHITCREKFLYSWHQTKEFPLLVYLNIVSPEKIKMYNKVIAHSQKYPLFCPITAYVGNAEKDVEKRA
jgi:hypothetical protein